MHRVVSRILDANDLGTLRGDPRTPKTPARTVLQPSRGFGSNGDGEEAPPDLWDPDANAPGRRDGAQGAGGKEWNLLVVNDEKIVNAMAAPGMQAHQYIRSLDVHVI